MKLTSALRDTGQRQRIALARSIVADPRILILDEATSALDNRVQAVVKTALDNICRGRTTINISHRLSTIIDADHIIVMDKGVIVEHGTHHELVEKKGMYAEMWNAQKMESAPPAPADLAEDDKPLNASRTSLGLEDEADEALGGDEEALVNTGEPKKVGLWYCLLEIFVEMRAYYWYYIWGVVACLIGGQY